MAAKRILRVALLSLIAFSLQAAYVAPARAIEALRAAHCCAARCHHAQSATTASRCCNVAQDGTDAATLSATKASPPSSATAPLLLAPMPLGGVHFATSAGIAPHLALRAALPAAPIYLLTRTLRL